MTTLRYWPNRYDEDYRAHLRRAGYVFVHAKTTAERLERELAEDLGRGDSPDDERRRIAWAVAKCGCTRSAA
jgi:hypothetical protein